MDKKNRKELILEYKNMKPEMGILSIQSTLTKEVYLGWAKDLKAGINSTQYKLNSNGYFANRELQTLWNTHGESNFELKIMKVLPYEKDSEKIDYSEDLESLLQEYLKKINGAKRVNKFPKSL